MDKYFVLTKDDIAIQIARGSKKPTSEIFEVSEITREEFVSIKLPCKKIDGVWTKVDEMPEIEYPAFESKGVVERQPTQQERIEALELAVEMLCMEDVEV